MDQRVLIKHSIQFVLLSGFTFWVVEYSYKQHIFLLWLIWGVISFYLTISALNSQRESLPLVVIIE